MRAPMKRCQAWVFVVTSALGAVPGAGQTVFFDDFDGNALLPHWEQPPPEHWIHTVSGSMLQVDRVLWPSSPKQPFNATGILAEVPPILGDFWAETRLGWDAGEEGAVGIILTAPASGTQLFASLIFGDGQIVAENATSKIIVPAPASGLHEFVISRSGLQLTFYVDGASIGTLPATSATPPEQVRLLFFEPYPEPGTGTLRVDYVRLVPAPGGIVALAASILLLATRRRSA